MFIFYSVFSFSPIFRYPFRITIQEDVWGADSSLRYHRRSPSCRKFLLSSLKKRRFVAHIAYRCFSSAPRRETSAPYESSRNLYKVLAVSTDQERPGIGMALAWQCSIVPMEHNIYSLSDKVDEPNFNYLQNLISQEKANLLCRNWRHVTQGSIQAHKG